MIRFSILCFVFLTPLSAFETDDFTHGALSSLLFYAQSMAEDLDEETNCAGGDSAGSTITFSEIELDELWGKLALSSYDCNELEESYFLFQQALSNQQKENSALAKSLFRQSSKILEHLWVEGSISEKPFKDREIFDRKSIGKEHHDFSCSSFTKEERKALKQYFLPFSSSLKPKLDAIFLKERVIQDENSFKAAGFHVIYSRPRSFIKVAEHPDLSGYLVKVYLDNELREKAKTPYWKWFYYRCKGVHRIHKAIRKKKLSRFTAPKKWVYPLPEYPEPPASPEYLKKKCILVVEDMHIVSEKENLKAWKTQITREHLRELYKIISYATGSSYRADNIPYTKEGKFAFIDTEYPKAAPNFKDIRPYLTSEMRSYWDELVKNGGS